MIGEGHLNLGQSWQGNVQKDLEFFYDRFHVVHFRPQNHVPNKHHWSSNLFQIEEAMAMFQMQIELGEKVRKTSIWLKGERTNFLLENFLMENIR